MFVLSIVFLEGVGGLFVLAVFGLGRCYTRCMYVLEA